MATTDNSYTIYDPINDGWVCNGCGQWLTTHTYHVCPQTQYHYQWNATPLKLSDEDIERIADLVAKKIIEELDTRGS